MGACDDGLEADFAGDGDGNGGLRPGLMMNEAGRGKGVAALFDDFLDLFMEPLGSLDTVPRVEVAIVERGEACKLLLDLPDVDVLDDLLHLGLIVDLVWVVDSGHEASRCVLVVLPFDDVKEVDVVLAGGEPLSRTPFHWDNSHQSSGTFHLR